jgi:hypothetical protein
VLAIFEGKLAKAGLYPEKILKENWDDYKERGQDIKDAEYYVKQVREAAQELNERRDRLQSRISLNNLRKDKGEQEIEAQPYKEADDPLESLLDRAKKLKLLDDAYRDETSSIRKAVTQFKIDVVASDAKIKYYERDSVSKQRLARANEYKDLHTFLKTHLSYQAQLKSSEKNTTKANATFKIPIPLGSITIDQINPADERSRESDRTVKLAASFEELINLKSENCITRSGGSRFPLRYPIEGNVGLHEVIVQYMKIVLDKGKFNLKAAKDADTYSDKITFKTTISGGASPKISITQSTGHTFTGSIDLSGSRTDEHILTVILTQENDKDQKDNSAKTTKVEIEKGKIMIERQSDF